MSAVDSGAKPMPMSVEIDKVLRFNPVSMFGFAVAILVTGVGWGTVSATVAYEMSDVRKQIEIIQKSQASDREKYEQTFEIIREQQNISRSLIERMSRNETNIENANKRTDRVVDMFNTNLEKTNSLLIETSKNVAVLTNELRVRQGQQK